MSTTAPIGSSTSSFFTENPLSGKSKALDQNDFLTLLVKQIQYQDPMNPKSNTDMAAQMAQFTSLQQATESSSSLQMIKASGLIGKQVLLQVDEKHQATGVVSGLIMKNGQPQIIVGEDAYELGQVLSVTPAPVAAPTTSTTN